MKVNVLFVDDDPNLINGLRRMFYPLRNEWDLFFAGGGEEALHILAENEMDVMVTDMRMPVINGEQLLQQVQEKYPRVIRIILSGYSNEEMSLRSAKLAHQFLAKPCSSDNIKYSIEKAIQLRNLLRNANLQRAITGIGNLPSLPDLYLKLEKELKSPNYSLQNVGKIISQDVTMSAKILQLVNSAFFGLPTQITNPIQAVNLLGGNIVKSLVLYVKVFSSLKDADRHRSMIEDIWAHSTKTATFTQEIVKLETQKKDVLDDAYISGILHDIGKLVFFQMPEYQESVLPVLQRGEDSAFEVEQQQFGTTHAEVGGYLMGLWGLPQQVVEAIALHHRPIFPEENKFNLVTAVYLANRFADSEEITLDFLAQLKKEEKLTNWLKSISMREVHYEG